MMKIRFLILSLVMIMAGMVSVAHADLDSFLKSVNIEAQADMGDFSVKLSAQFGTPVPDVNAIIKAVASPADAFMVLQLGQMAGKEPEVALQTYRRSRGKGWGAIAQELGIKPGSPEFHALKSGDLSFTGESGGGHKGEKGKGKGPKK